MREIRIGNTVEMAVERGDYPPEKINAVRQGRILYASVPGEEGPMAQFIQPLADFPDKTGKVAYRLYSIDFDRYLAWLNQ